MHRQLPGYSPIALEGLIAGLGAAASGRSQVHREFVRSAIVADLNAHSVVLTDSGTSALALALGEACRAKSKRLVALPAYCCFDIATAADGADVDVVLYDIDPKTLSPDLESLESALEHAPAAVVVAHLYGIPVDVDSVWGLCNQADTMIIEDAAQGHDASYRGRPLGSLGRMSVLSFGRGKGVTGGAGGALLANDEVGAAILETAQTRLCTAIRGSKNLLLAATQLLFGRPALYWIPASLPFLGLGETVYHRPHPPTDICHSAAAVLAKSWWRAKADAISRRDNAAKLQVMVEQSVDVKPITEPPGAAAGYLRLPIVANEHAQSILNTAEARQYGVAPGYPMSLVDLDGFSERCINCNTTFTGARKLADRLFTLPTHGMVSDKDLTHLHRLLVREPPTT